MTQGMLSIVSHKDKKVLIKIVAGCNGYNINKLSTLIKNQMVDFDNLQNDLSLTNFYELATLSDFGCEECLVVIGAKKVFHRCDDELLPLYRETFNNPKFNPRWECGVCGYYEELVWF